VAEDDVPVLFVETFERWDYHCGHHCL
jgi:hypothetical protein